MRSEIIQKSEGAGRADPTNMTGGDHRSIKPDTYGLLSFSPSFQNSTGLNITWSESRKLYILYTSENLYRSNDRSKYIIQNNGREREKHIDPLGSNSYKKPSSPEPCSIKNCRFLRLRGV
jgi:hypothetical protein